MTSQTWTWSPTAYQTNAAFVPLLTTPILTRLAPQRDETIMDLGCGDGILTAKLAKEYGLRKVVGTDGSPEMVDAAKKEVERCGVQGVCECVVWDGQEMEKSVWAGKAVFDAVFSNAALHWMKRDPAAVIRGVKSILKPGGRFVAECGAHLNCATIHSALIAAVTRRGYDGLALSPWYFPTKEEYKTLLESHGFKVLHIEATPRQTPLPTDIGGWVDTFGGSFMAPLTPEQRKEVREEVVQTLRPVLCDREGKWTVDYVRLRFVAVLE
ncbi:hypothetical protein HK104_003956 [Borealophlyctis nickersoniae]|nr:hypothetical protein HK104_003956 [Borealophlyctis nickersoniae]